jgi:hypothetical protein
VIDEVEPGRLIKPSKILSLSMPNNKPPVTGKYIDPLVDFAFKKIFGSEPNKDYLYRIA